MKSPGSPAEVLIIEDDPQILRFLRPTLMAENYVVHDARNAAEGLAQAAARQPDLLLLDLGLPDGDGLNVIVEIRRWSQTPILVLSARGQESDKVAALDAGADDFVSKPFATGELLARMRAALRRTSRVNEKSTVFRVGEIEVDLEKRLVFVKGQETHLTPIEFKLLQVLVRHAGRVITQRQLLHEVWGPNHVEQAQYLRVYMGQLRRKLEADPAQPRFLRTESGVGYRLVME